MHRAGWLVGLDGWLAGWVMDDGWMDNTMIPGYHVRKQKADTILNTRRWNKRLKECNLESPRLRNVSFFSMTNYSMPYLFSNFPNTIRPSNLQK